jgi:dUTP pyrophosphatase
VEEGVMVVVRVVRLDNFPDDWSLPEYATEGSAAVDMRNAGETVVLPPMGRQLVPTGLAIALPANTEAQIRPRSGLALRRGVTIINTPCTIDSDYRGEIRIPMVNLDREPQTIEHGERVAQLLVATVARIEWSEVDALPETVRGSGGFGSTGR